MEEKIKVLYITSLFNKMGGAERNIYNIVCNINKMHFIPYIFCLQGGELVAKLNSKGIYAKTIGLSKIFSIEAVRKGVELYKFIKKEKIKIVVTYHHDADIWGGIIAMLARTPVVISSRRDMGYQLEKKQIWAYRLLNRLYTKIIAVSDAVKNEIAAREWTNPDKIITIYNGVKYDDFQTRLTKEERALFRKSFGIEPSDIVIGNFGTFRPVKGQLYLAQAIKEVIKKHNNIKCLFVGSIESEYFKEVEAFINEHKLNKYFIFTGNCKDIPYILSIIDIYVLSSISEGFSNAVLEAMAAAKPVIATAIGGNLEAIIDQKTGLLFPPCDSHSLFNTIEKLLENNTICQTIGEEGLNRVKTTFTLQKMMEITEGLYEYLLLKKFKSRVFLPQSKQTIKKIIKLSLSYLLYYSGSFHIFALCRKRAFIILAYHSINNITLKPLEIEQDTACFERQIRYLKTNYKILSLTEFIEFRNNGKKYPPNSILITLDDGYRDNYINAYPILKKYKVPASIFLTVKPIETKIPLFFDLLRFAILKTPRLILDISDLGLKKYILEKENKYSLFITIKEIINYSKSLNEDSKEILIKIIYTRLGLDINDIDNMQGYLSWDQIKEMADNSIEFGSHTMTHPQLSSLSLEKCKEELSESKKIIEARIGRKVRTIAYPFGGRKDYNEMVEKVALEAGYEHAFSLCRDKNIGTYTIGRKLVDSHMSSTCKGNFSKPLFASEINIL